MRSVFTRLESLDKPIRLAIIGIGSVGEGLLYQSSLTPGMQCVAIADVNLGKVVKAARGFDLPHRVVDSEGQLHNAIKEGMLAVCQEGDGLAEDVTVSRDIAKDEKIFMDDITYDPNRFDFELFSLPMKATDAVTS